jgi:hypothetical protein
MAQRQAQTRVQDLQTIQFRTWRRAALRDQSEIPGSEQQTVQIRIASMNLGDESEEQDSGDEREEEEDAGPGPSPEQDHSHSTSQPGPSTSQITDEQ